MLQVDKATDNQRYNLRIEGIGHINNCQNSIQIRQLLPLLHGLYLDFVPKTGSQADKQSVREESAQENHPFDLEPNVRARHIDVEPNKV